MEANTVKQPSSAITSPKYCNNLGFYSRFKTRAVRVGGIAIGGDNPIRLQSMTTADTMDTQKTVEQSIRMIEAGCELVRITAPSKKEALHLSVIKAELKKRGYNTPLVADIHFTPNAAEIAARIVEKVRVNPGNYADKKKFEQRAYTDKEYEFELERIRERFVPLVKICKEHGTAMRIGTNHGSLSDRIMNRYGDSPLGMVESALEFVRICQEFDYREIVLSMKASNPIVMVQAYRLLVHKMMAEGMNYPLHLGVTEAGEGEDGRIKSAVGIGTLLEDGLGDTIRVSLTEEPEFEIPVARAIAERYRNRTPANKSEAENWELPYSPFAYERRKSQQVFNMGNRNAPVVILSNEKEVITHEDLAPFGYRYAESLDKWGIDDQACDYLFSNHAIPFEIPGTLSVICPYENWLDNRESHRHFPLLEWEAYSKTKELHPLLNFVRIAAAQVNEEIVQKLDPKAPIVLVIEEENQGIHHLRKVCTLLQKWQKETPVVLKLTHLKGPGDNLAINASVDAGSLLVDGFGDGLWLGSKENISAKQLKTTAFGILQATRTRISKTEYISCPSCGRTLFDLQETTAKIRVRTDHLKGVKIGIMGCIVNGPGEMADADYGYVGTGPGKITLYKEKTVVKRNVPAAEAVDELIALIRDHGDWVEPEKR